MLLRQLREFFPPERHDDVDRAYQRFQRSTGGDDVVAFVTQLHAQGVISTETLRDILTLGEVTLTAPPDPRADRLSPRHRLITEIARGAMGKIDIGRDPDLERTVAVKRIDASHLKKPSIIQRFFAEAQITAQLDHPNIVPIYSIERDDDAGFLRYTMKLVRGQTLKDLIRDLRAAYEAGGRPPRELSLKRRLELFLPICHAVAYAHRRGVLHRDLKPENVMVGAFGQVLVMDWGIARPIGSRERVTDGDVAEKTRAGMVVGTPNYLSPEQARGETDELTAASDQYSLGLILWELVTCLRAVEGESSIDVVIKAAGGETRLLEHVNPKIKVPRELKGIIETATALDPAHRYPSVEAFAEDIGRYLRDEPVLAAPDTFTQKLKRWVSRHRGLTLGLGVGLVMMVFLVAALVMWRGAVALHEEKVASQAREDAQRAAAQAREVRLVELGSEVNEQAHAMDARFYSYEALLTGLGVVSEYLLQQPNAPPVKRYFPADFADPTRAPPDLTVSRAFRGEKVSFREPDYVLAPGVDEAAITPRLNQLSTLTPALVTTLLRSAGPDALTMSREAQRALVIDKGVPFVFTYAAIEEGALIGYPGLGVYPDDYDPRERAWYKLAKRLPGPQWGAAEADESGMGLLLTCSMALTDEGGTFHGVVAVDLAFRYIINELLDPDALSGYGEAYLIDGDGKVVIRSSQKSLTDVENYKQPTFAYKELLASFERQTTGHATIDVDGEKRLALWSRLAATGWTYAFIGPEKGLIKP